MEKRNGERKIVIIEIMAMLVVASIVLGVVVIRGFEKEEISREHTQEEDDYMLAVYIWEDYMQTDLKQYAIGVDTSASILKMAKNLQQMNVPKTFKKEHKRYSEVGLGNLIKSLDHRYSEPDEAVKELKIFYSEREVFFEKLLEWVDK